MPPSRKRKALQADRAKVKIRQLQEELNKKKRELKIEAALERVRARTMAMNASSELSEVGNMVFRQMKQLGIHAETSWLWFINTDNNSLEIWTTHKNKLARPINVKASDLWTFKREIDAWKNGEAFLKLQIPKKDAVKVISKIFGITVRKERKATHFHLLQVRHKFGFLGMGSWYESTADEMNSCARFAKVFEQTYTRFLDLQKAEAQAREAEIELALERVRSRSMAMHKTNELFEAAELVYKELTTLGITSFSVSYAFVDEDKKHDEYYGVNPMDGKIFPFPVIFPQNETAVMRSIMLSWKKREPFNLIELDEEGIRKHQTYIGEHILAQLIKNKIDIPFSVEEFVKESPETAALYSFNYTSGYLFIIREKKLTTDEEQIVLRFTKVFNQTYTRFLDLQKAEAQAQEAQIEAALERVRSSAMAMHSSDDVTSATATMFTELEKLGIGNIRGGIAIVSKDQTMEVWSVTNLAGGRTVKGAGTFDMMATPLWQHLFIDWSNKGEYFSEYLTGKEKEDYIKVINSNPHYLSQPIEQLPDLYFQSYNFGEGVVWTYSLQLHSEGERKVMKRFTSVFSLTFRRFRDLKKAEAQAREAQIEAALEKVRSRSLAMHKSDDLQQVVNSVFDRMVELGVKMNAANFLIFNEGRRDYDLWVAVPGHIYSSRMYMTEINYSPTKELFEARENGNDFFTITLSFEDKNKWFNYAFEHSGLKQIPTERKKLILEGKCWTVSWAISKHSAVQLNSYSRESFTESEHEILKRFAKVFEQAYTRFLDLEKAEAQAREAQIEAALEKVRSRSLSMHKSEELIHVVTVTLQKLSELDIDMEMRSIVLVTYQGDSKDVVQWVASPALSTARSFKTAYVDHPIMRDLWLARKSGIHFFSKAYSVEEKNSLFSYFFERTDHKLMPEEEKDWILERSHYAIEQAIEKNSAITVVSFSEKMLAEEEREILKRFARVFEQAYVRFLDLQKAEGLAREAQIEAALERVRSRSMAMQNSNELADLVSVLFKELTQLDFILTSCIIWIHNTETETNELWVASSDLNKPPYPLFIKPFHHGFFSSIVHAWREKNKKWIFSLSGKDKMEFQEAFIAAVPDLPDALKNTIRTPDTIVFSASFNNIGALEIVAPDALTDEKFEILHRFGRVFDLTYTRFNDLKVAEAQALQAEKDLMEIKAARQKAEIALSELKAAQSQLIQSEKMASLGELTAGIAHEIQNPLNFVNNFSEVSNELLVEMKEEIEKGNVEEVKAIAQDVIQNLEKILHHGKRADGIVKGMLQHSRSGSGIKELTDVNALADEYLRLAYHGLRAKDKSFNARFETQLDETLEKIEVVPQDIGRVILNLITNAFYAVTEKRKTEREKYKPTVKVSTKKVDGNVLISVTDNGNGIPQHIKEKIFQPFFTTKPTGQGTGLGLSLAYDIVKAHGGELKVETKEGYGSVFTIQLHTNS